MEGKDIVVKIPITFSEAVLAGKKTFLSLTAKWCLRSKESRVDSDLSCCKGIKSGKNGRRGNEFVELLIKLPKPPDAAYIEAAEKLKTSGFDPRAGIFQS